MKVLYAESTGKGGERDVILVMGSLFVELVPEPAGGPLVAMQRLVPTAAGAAANLALALASLEMPVGMLSRVGGDELGGWLCHRLQEKRIRTEGIGRVPGELTPLSLAWVDQRGGKKFVFYRFPGHCDPLASLSPADLPQEALGKARAFDFTEAVIRNPSTRAAAFAAAEYARQAGAEVVYAVNYRPQLWHGSEREIRSAQREAIARAQLVLMNEEEYRLIFPRGANVQAGKGRIVVVTAGEQGGWVETEGCRERFAAFPVEVEYDVGAGDSFHAGFLAAYLRGQSPLAAARFGAAYAALKISRPASSPPPTRAQVEAFLRTCR